MEQMKYGQGGQNACQFVKEQVPGIRDDIANVEVIEQDSLLGDIGIIFAKTELAKKSNLFLAKEITKDEFEAFVDSITHNATDIAFSWQFGIVVNDSLKQLEKYKYQWRKVYKIRVTMKSGITKEPRVLMDDDGITPRMLETDMEKTLNDFTKDVIDATHLIYQYY